MSTALNLGKVVGDPGLINEVNDLDLDAASNGGILYNDNNGNVSITMDTNVVQTKLSGNPTVVVGFDEDGNVTNVPMGYELYGFELDMDETYGPNMVRYIAQNKLYQPAALSNGTFSYGDWEDVWFIKNLKPCMLRYDGTVAYDLNKNDYTKKADGTASDVANDAFAGNAMVGLPTVWVKVDTSVARKPKFYFCNMQLNGDFKCYAHHDNDGNVMPYTYLPIYNGWVDSDNRLRSISGKTPTASQAGATQITEARANNIDNAEIWDIEKFCDRQLINLLLILISKTTDSQTAFGNGNMNGSSNPATGAGANGVLPTGTMDTNGLFYGSTANNLGVKVFGMEHYWGNLLRLHTGILLSSGTFYYKLTYSTEDGSTVTGFDPTVLDANAGTPTGWKHDIGGISNGSAVSYYYQGYIGDMYAGEYGLMPKSLSGGSSTSKYYDYCWYSTSVNHTALYSGHSNHGLSCGAFTCFMANVLSDSYWSMGASISCKPKKTELYGFELDMDKTYGQDMVTYIGENKNFRQASMNYTTGQFDYGDWENAWFIKNLRPCMLRYDGTVAYDLNKNDYTKKADGTASDVANDSFAGNAMVGLPTVWVKVDTSMPRKPRFYFADKQIDSSYKAYAHTASNGSIMDYTYLGIYNSSRDSSGRNRSLSGKSVVGKSYVSHVSTNINACRLNNLSSSNNWDIEKFCDRQLINLLLVLISKTTDSQTAFGRGNVIRATEASIDSLLDTGTMDTNGLFWGSDDGRGFGVKVFGIEHYWGNTARAVMGLAMYNDTLYYKLTYGTEDGSTVTGFDPASITDNAGAPTGWKHDLGGAVNGYIGDMYAGEYGLIPKSNGGSSSSKYYDQFDIYPDKSKTTTSYIGGYVNEGSVCGVFRTFFQLLDTSWHIFDGVLSYKK